VAAALAQREHTTVAALARDAEAIADVREELRRNGAILSYGLGRSSGRTRS
jgi:hypothetical protein